MTQPFPISIGRVYDPPDPGLGARLLVDRLWPRGIRKSDLYLDDWLRQVTPSNDLRKWYHADPASRYPEFARRYEQELSGNPDGVGDCLQWCRKGPVLLLTAAHDPETSHVPVLRALLHRQLQAEDQP